MSRWHARLAELRASRNEAIPPVQNVQNSPTVPTFEHFEHIEQRTEPSGLAGVLPEANQRAALAAPRSGSQNPAAPASDRAPADLLGPLFKPTSPADGEPGLEQPCATRRGRVQELEHAFLHFCVVCGRFGAFGYGVSLRTGKPGRWYCAAHRPAMKPE
jgi:hypothetical protein